MYANEDDVISQMQGWGLDLDRKPLTVGQLTRTKVQGRKGRKGWYHLHEFHIDDKDTGRKVVLLTGAFGHFEGPESFYCKVELKKNELPKISPEQLKENRLKQAEAEKRAKNELASRQKKAALQAQRVWHRCNRTGHADYLSNKLIRGHDVRYTESNAVVIPLQDETGYIWGLQFILDKANHKDKIAKREGNNKEFWPLGIAKKGHFYQIGPMITTVCLVCEGYATGASLYEATGLPVVVCFDAGNIDPVLRALAEYYKDANFLICADDDDLYGCQNCHDKIQISRIDDFCPHCGQPHRRKNAGVEAAMRACFDQRIRWIRPKFDDNNERFSRYVRNQGKLTDYNDLHVLSSLSVVRRQVDNVLRDFGWALGTAARVAQPGGAGSNDNTDLRTVDTTAEAIARFSYIYAEKPTIFDHQEHILVSMESFQGLLRNRDIYPQWKSSSHRKVYKKEHVGFDPAESDDNIKCNLWSGWPTEPKDGDCEPLLELLHHLCSGEQNSAELYCWVLKWLAYPIQHPGAKMRSALVIHGPQGSGKNLFTETVKSIYGDYGLVIDQHALEDKHNDFAFSKKLFVIADEVVARSDRFHVKNILKGLITGDTISINPKNVTRYKEANHINLVFLSNEIIPVVLEEDDRRYCVIWTPPPWTKSKYKAIKRCLDSGGGSHLHHYLAHLDLGDYDEHAEIPMTSAKEDLVDASKEVINRFYAEWLAGDIPGIPLVPVLLADLFRLLRAWCNESGSKSLPSKWALGSMLKKKREVAKQKKYYWVGSQRLQHDFYHPPLCQTQPIGKNSEAFYAECVEQFRTAIDNFKGGAYGN